MRDIINKLSNAGVVPVVVIENAADAVPTARALLAGGIDVMEVTFRTAAAAECIRLVAEECPEMTVGAGTVITPEQCEQAVELGAKFIVSPGYDEEVVRRCVDKGVPVTPGCVTPTEITAALRHGLKVLKFFPANIYGGLNAMKALAGPFGGIKFIPTGGISAQNCGEYSTAPFVHAVGGSWICTKADIAAHSFEKITALCREARQAVLGFEVAHIGINCTDADASREVCQALSDAFGFPAREGNSSIFSTSAIEVMKSDYLGERGHIAIRTNKISMAVDVLEKRGYTADMETAKYKGERMAAVYLRKEFGGFAVHLLQK